MKDYLTDYANLLTTMPDKEKRFWFFMFKDLYRKTRNHLTIEERIIYKKAYFFEFVFSTNGICTWDLKLGIDIVEKQFPGDGIVPPDEHDAFMVKMLGVCIGQFQIEHLQFIVEKENKHINMFCRDGDRAVGVDFDKVQAQFFNPVLS